jgi:hypothetical protein
MITITDSAGRVLGFAAGVLDLAGTGPEMGGKDPAAPLTFTTLLVVGRLRIGHTFALDDPDAPIWMEEQPPPGRVRDPDFRCSFCVTKSSIARQYGDTFVILEHTRTCRWMRRMARKYPSRAITP